MKMEKYKIWWLWVPVLFMVFQAGIETFLPSKTLSIMHSESGPHEFLQAVLLACSVCIAILMLIKMDRKHKPFLTGWIGLAALCCLYVLGEEISYGQHLFDWATPEFWADVNDQQETNLHNTSSWLDQKPRLLLELGVIVGGLVIPLLARYKPKWLPARFDIIYPSALTAVTAGIFLLLKITDKVTDGMGVSLFERVSEVQELYLFYFVLLYLLILRSRIL